MKSLRLLLGLGAAIYPAGHVISGSPWDASPASTATINGESARVGAFPLLSGSNDKADVYILSPGDYTISIAPISADETGIELLEIYEVE